MPTMAQGGLFRNLQGLGPDYKYGADVNNQGTVRGVYGGAPGATVGQVGSAMTPNSMATSGLSLSGTYSEAPTDSGVPMQGAAAPNGSPLGSPVVWLVILALVLVGFRFLAQKGGEGKQYANVHVTIWNVILITLVAMVGFVFAKVVFTKFNIPGLSTLIRAA